MGALKVNVDAALSNDGYFTGIGVVIRDHMGTVKGALAHKISGAFRCYLLNGSLLGKSSLAEEGPFINDILVIGNGSGNVVAHTLASFALSISSSIRWIDETPRFISSIVLDDLSYE
ncbi:hypothetical protein PanWU01x14_152630 [Parasponia andersonii]|uniref:RNase H type-1 domain-containing protein n=1 Tax=Parasponia andersonii TaxID=3476 RepID=A0A2P5CHD4_PARAD|nr:hypothetical protein PanWU01x14_152630 [Parasponia andersonii]